jgi:hypothetical protein
MTSGNASAADCSRSRARRAAPVMTARGPAEEPSQRPYPESVFPQVKVVRVVRGGVEPPTFRFSGVLSPLKP